MKTQKTPFRSTAAAALAALLSLASLVGGATPAGAQVTSTAPAGTWTPSAPMSVVTWVSLLRTTSMNGPENVKVNVMKARQTPYPMMCLAPVRKYLNTHRQRQDAGPRTFTMPTGPLLQTRLIAASTARRSAAWAGTALPSAEHAWVRSARPGVV